MTGYIKFLRDYVGHQPIQMVGAGVFVENERGELLLGLRIGETVEEGAKREMFEETGLIAEELELLGVFSGEDTHYTYPNGDEVYVIDVKFVCRKFHGTLKPQESEVSELRFFPIAELPENISPMEIISVNKYLQMRKNFRS